MPATGRLQLHPKPSQWEQSIKQIPKLASPTMELALTFLLLVCLKLLHCVCCNTHKAESRERNSSTPQLIALHVVNIGTSIVSTGPTNLGYSKLTMSGTSQATPFVLVPRSTGTYNHLNHKELIIGFLFRYLALQLCIYQETPLLHLALLLELFPPW